MDEVDCGQAQPCGEYAVVGGGNAAALQVAEDCRAGFDARHAFDLSCNVVADSAEPRPTISSDRRHAFFCVNADRHEPFCDDDNRCAAAIAGAFNPFDDPLHRHGEFGQQDGLCAGGHTGVQRNPADVPAHNLNDHAPVVRFCCGAQGVDGPRGNSRRCVEAERVVSAAEVVVNGFGNTNHGQSLIVSEPRGTSEGALAADGNHPVDPVVLHDLAHRIRPTPGVRVGARRAENSSTSAADAAHIVRGQGVQVALQQATPSVADAHEFVTEEPYALADGASDDCVESGAVAAGGQNSDLHCGPFVRVGGGAGGLVQGCAAGFGLPGLFLRGAAHLGLLLKQVYLSAGRLRGSN